MSDNYIAITIGPIYDTITLTSSPAGLWAASYMFSHITKRLCEMIVAHVDEERNRMVKGAEDILSPFFPTEKEKGEHVIIDGIGSYHDIIIFKPVSQDKPSTVLAEVQKLFDSIAEEIAKPFDENSTEWFKQYLQLHAYWYKSVANPILDCSKYLGAIELEKTYPTAGVNPLADLLDSNVPKRNINIRDNIRKSFSGGKWPFQYYENEKGEERLPDMEDITGRRKETERRKDAKKNKEPEPERRKINSYYAIVQTDGDHFGDYIKTWPGEKRDFSKKCLTYCSESAKAVQAYGGAPIYAGGDDLLFIAPLTGKIGENEGSILELLVKLREIFEETFVKPEGESHENGAGTGEVALPTLSLGVVIRYYKYPLYEAFGEAVQQLFWVAKKQMQVDDEKKHGNTAAISLQKHSGQSIAFLLPTFNAFHAEKNPILFSYLVEKLPKVKGKEEVLESIRSKIWEFEELFCIALSLRSKGSETALRNAFHNTFDAEIHKDNQDLKDAMELLDYLNTNKKDNSKEQDPELEGKSIQDDGYPAERAVLRTFDTLLRFAKFWREEGDDGDA